MTYYSWFISITYYIRVLKKCNINIEYDCGNIIKVSLELCLN